MAGSPEGGLGAMLKNAVAQRVIGAVGLVITAVIVGSVNQGLSLLGGPSEETETVAVSESAAPPAASSAAPEAAPEAGAMANAGANVAPVAAAKSSSEPVTKVAAASNPSASVVTAVRPDPKRAAVPAHLDAHLTYQYNALGRRDPFNALVGGDFIGADVGGDAPPDPGGMKVVGIVWGANDQFAMVEDVRGNSYVLRKGDKVQNGYIESLKRDAVLVTVTSDGQSQTVSIPLERKGDSNAR